MFLFTIATISPFLLILAAVFFGGIWAWGALGFLTILAFSLDRLAPEEIENANPEVEFPASAKLLLLLGISHLAILPLGLWAIAAESGLSMIERGLIAAATAMLFGQISHPVAHELIHQPRGAAACLARSSTVPYCLAITQALTCGSIMLTWAAPLIPTALNWAKGSTALHCGLGPMVSWPG